MLSANLLPPQLTQPPVVTSASFLDPRCAAHPFRTTHKCGRRCRKLGLSGCMRIEGPGLGLHGLAGGTAVEEGRLRVLGLRGLNVASRSSQRVGPGSQLLDNALGELLAALVAARCEGCYAT